MTCAVNVVLIQTRRYPNEKGQKAFQIEDYGRMINQVKACHPGLMLEVLLCF